MIKADKKCIIRQIYQHIYQNVENRQYVNTWCWQIMKLLQELNLENLWTNQDKENAVNYKFIINTSLKEYFREQWIQSAKHSHKGLNYIFRISDIFFTPVSVLPFYVNYNSWLWTARYRIQKQLCFKFDIISRAFPERTAR